MIVVDASALLAIYLAEPERRDFIRTIRAADDAIMSPINYWEALVRAQSENGAMGVGAVGRLIAKLKVVVGSVDADDARAAAEAFARFGRRTPAGLNLGDCFAYALAKRRNAPLLYKGGDFGKTDIAAA